MFNPVASFAKQFHPIEGGYLYYPSRKSGGKLVSESEFQSLLINWKRVAGSRGSWVSTFIIIAWVTVVMALAEVLKQPWLTHLAGGGAVVILVARVGWVSFAPRRLVKHRPDIAPARTMAESRRQARRVIPWSMVVFGFILGAALFSGGLSSQLDNFWAWASLVGGGAMLAGYVWLAALKYFDSRH